MPNPDWIVAEDVQLFKVHIATPSYSTVPLTGTKEIVSGNAGLNVTALVPKQ
jgi:hypothetical protein